METPRSNDANQWAGNRTEERTGKRAGIAVVVVALAVAFSGSAFAQGSPSGPDSHGMQDSHDTSSSPGTVGGSATDMTSAGNVEGMPQIQQQGAVSYVSGGVGIDESTALKQQAPRWPLAMRFTGRASEYLGDVQVRIVDRHGADVLSTQSQGPYMLVKLAPGQYTVHASYNDREQTRSVMVSSRPGARADFSWTTQ
ncbi:MAG TPA: carboxypeptidase regulatory-like domain-containing protein [Trinickia sp.]|jgi:hypothetical protein|uniref:carboxypeptidase regulatory-like domain-containing protein n=1 Tax=Trinickia sp. TaxID=2571163 RepID=UPI002C2E0C92|nr:carboxypeptidase regulatory-like domain-containing protein [Trinickia sp.]HTI18959.1 carboxypeptidase regulatory-like domain-containing protein [Trinickia sp.]